VYCKTFNVREQNTTAKLKATNINTMPSLIVFSVETGTVWFEFAKTERAKIILHVK